MSTVASPPSVAARDVCKPAVSSSSSSSSSPAISCSGRVTFLYNSDESAFGWREGLVAGEFAKQLRIAVLHVTGLSSLEGVELVLEHGTAAYPKGQRVTPRDFFQGKFSSDNTTVFIRIVPPSVPTERLASDAASGSRTPAATDSAAPSSRSSKKAVAFEAEDVPLSRTDAPARQAPKVRADKAGGSQMQFMQLVAANKNPKAVLDKDTRLTISEVARHRRKGDCWTIYQGQVYDITLYLDFHPGSKKELMKGAGKDCTELYNQVHPWVSIDGLLGNLCLGSVVAETTATDQDAVGTQQASDEARIHSSAAEDQAITTDVAPVPTDPRAPAGYPQEI